MSIKSEAITSQLPQLSMSDPAKLQQLTQIADDRKRAETVAGQLEGVFMNMMVKAMRSTAPEGGLIGRGMGGQMYVEMLDQHWVESGGGPVDAAMHESLVRELMQSNASAMDAFKALNNSPHPLQTAEIKGSAPNIEEGGKGKASGF